MTFHRTTYSRITLAIALLWPTALAAQEPRSPIPNSQPPTPNIILIMADDLGAECLSSYGSLDDHTPRLDALAQAGARFTQVHSQPLCTPSRVQIMTGKYNFRNYDEFGYLDPDEATFADYLRQAGFQTAIAGKWQLSGQGKQYPEQTDPADWGFDEHCLWQLNNRKPYGDRGPRFWDPYLEKNGQVVRPGQDAYGPDVCAEFLMDFMTRNKDERFFVYYPMILTHGPYMPTPDSDSERPRGKKDNRNFRDMVAYMDKTVGRLVDHVDQLGLADETLIIFTGDNGTGKGVTTRTQQGEVEGGKGTTTQAGTHVPLIIRWPGKIQPETTDGRLVDFTDVLPSLLAAARVEIPERAVLDGVPFLDREGLSENQREAIYCWYQPRQGKNSARHNAIFARNQEYKLYADGYFFNVKKTPKERDEDALNEPLSKEAQASLQALQAVLEKYK